MMMMMRNLFAAGVNAFMGCVLAVAVGVAPIVGAVAVLVAGVLLPRIGGGVLCAGLYAEVWTGELIKKFRASMESIGWINRVQNISGKVADNNTLNFVDIGGDPTVLVNNTSYPIGVETLEDANKSISLDRYQTVATKITDDELHGLSYDKIGSVIERHHEAIAEQKYGRALHALAPARDTKSTPVVVTTGEADGTRGRITRADIIALKAKFDALRVPVQGRVLVLCPDHVNDLLLVDQKFAEQYYNYTSGKISNLYGFEVYEFQNAPYYKVSTMAKVAYGTAIAGATDRYASVAFYAPRMVRADGVTKTYLQDATTSPTTQENLVNFRTYFICLPLKNEAIGAIVSAVVAPA